MQQEDWVIDATETPESDAGSLPSLPQVQVQEVPGFVFTGTVGKLHIYSSLDSFKVYLNNECIQELQGSVYDHMFFLSKFK